MRLNLREFNLLKKLMARTTSGADGERLGAIDHANRILAGHGLTWDAVFARTVSVGLDVEDAPEERDPRQEVDEMFEYLSERKFKSTFVESLHTQWESRRWLSTDQREALVRICDRERKRT